MGWFYSNSAATRRDLIHELLTERPRGGQRVVKHCLRGNILWGVYEVLGADGELQRFIGCDLLRNGGRASGWGYKDMDESVHPYYYSCPLAYLELAPARCVEWRSKVREYHARVNQPLRVGQTVELINSRIPHVTVTNVRPLRGTYRGTLYRVPRSMLAMSPPGATI